MKGVLYGMLICLCCAIELSLPDESSQSGASRATHVARVMKPQR